MLIMQVFFCRHMEIMVAMVTEIVKMFQKHIAWEPIKLTLQSKDIFFIGARLVIRTP